ncbi:MAG: hypothetical protein ACRC4M_00505 [Mycoplasma sp.]
MLNKKSKTPAIDPVVVAAISEGNVIYLNGLLSNVQGYELPTSVVTGEVTSFDKFVGELNQSFFSRIDLNSEESQAKLTKVVDALSFAISNLEDLPSALKNHLFSAVEETFNFLKKSTAYPSNEEMSDSIAFCIPLLKKISDAAKVFLTKNK